MVAALSLPQIVLMTVVIAVICVIVAAVGTFRGYRTARRNADDHRKHLDAYLLALDDALADCGERTAEVSANTERLAASARAARDSVQGMQTLLHAIPDERDRLYGVLYEMVRRPFSRRAAQ